MQDKIFKVLLILSAIVIPVIGGELYIPSLSMLLERLNILVSGTLSFQTIG